MNRQQRRNAERKTKKELEVLKKLPECDSDKAVFVSSELN